MTQTTYASRLRQAAQSEAAHDLTQWSMHPLPAHLVQSVICQRARAAQQRNLQDIFTGDIVALHPCIPTGWGTLYRIARTTKNIEVPWKLAVYVEQAALSPEHAEAYQRATQVRLADRKIGMPAGCILKSGGLLKEQGGNMAGFITGPDRAIAFTNTDAVNDFCDWLQAGYLDYLVSQVCAIVARDPELAHTEARTFRPYHLDPRYGHIGYLDELDHVGVGLAPGAPA